MIEHKVSYCSHCEIKIIICGGCGNNTCNGGYGILNGEQCLYCKDAYKKFFELENKMGDNVV